MFSFTNTGVVDWIIYNELINQYSIIKHKSKSTVNCSKLVQYPSQSKIDLSITIFIWNIGCKLGSLSAVTQHHDYVVCTEGFAWSAGAVCAWKRGTGHDRCACIEPPPLSCEGIWHGALLSLSHPVAPLWYIYILCFSMFTLLQRFNWYFVKMFVLFWTAQMGYSW